MLIGIKKQKINYDWHDRLTNDNCSGGDKAASGFDWLVMAYAIPTPALTHIPAHRFASQSFIRWAGTSVI
jgi:hypothetical protein